MRVAITGASGFIGQALTVHLREQGHEVVAMVRDRAKVGSSAVFWSAQDNEVDTASLEGTDAVVHLAGEPLASGRWNADVKNRILSSRVNGTTVLSSALASMETKPSVLVSGSAIGYYGNRGSLVLTDESPPGSGFLPDVCRAWEGATEPAVRAGIRVAFARTGVVLSAKGGALGKMLLPFKMGVGGKIGDGSQYFSWISLEDQVRAITHLLTSKLGGGVNLTGPAPVTNAAFTKALGGVVRRPTILPLPAAAVKALLGEMGERLVLDSARVVPQRLQTDGFVFSHPTVESALAWAVDH